ncbi:MAG: tetratricopeptide repeat protein [Acidobacteria bacterium]|nr:tetratricopeptide repeat protein [Acidobacteriota bacterium]
MRTRFNLGVSYLQAKETPAALAEFERVIKDGQAGSDLLFVAWSSFFIAEEIARTEPARARTLLQRVIEINDNDEGLVDKAKALLAQLNQRESE